MKHTVRFLLPLAVGMTFLVAFFRQPLWLKMSGAPPYGEAEAEVPADLDPYAWLKSWERPDGPARVGLQAGHWHHEDLPEELARLRENTGSKGGGKWEWEVNLAIAGAVRSLLEERGVVVDILPSTVPPSYWADAFVAIHADGSESWSANGYKVASPWRDFTGKAEALANDLQESYGRATGLPLDPNISHNMRGYYAFSWWRYTHAIHPMTTAVILETGFLTNAKDRQFLIGQPQVVAQGIAEGLLRFLESEGLL